MPGNLRKFLESSFHPGNSKLEYPASSSGSLWNIHEPWPPICSYIHEPMFIVQVWRNKGVAYYILLFVCRWHTTRATLSWRCITMSDTVARYKKSVRWWICVRFYFCEVINLILVDYKVPWYFCRFWSLYAPAFTSLCGGMIGTHRT